jgi:N-acetylmuramoyl-L-alanine amidase
VRRPTIVIDAGHGGKDGGSQGCLGLEEKHVTLGIAQKIKKECEAAGIRAVLTRASDQFLSLHERASLANQLKADLYISIHANAAAVSQPSGFETWHVNIESIKDSLRHAHLVFPTPLPLIQAIKQIDAQYLHYAHQALSLAEAVQKSTLAMLSQHKYEVRDRGRRAGFKKTHFNLQIPSIFVEVGFITNPVEARMLKDPTYTTQLARGIVRGLHAHLTK